MADEFVMLSTGWWREEEKLYDALQRSNVKTMADLRNTVKVQNKNVSINGEV